MEEKKLKINDQVVYFQSAENMEQVEDESVTLVVTSPPYWNARDYGFSEQIGFNQSYQEYIDGLNRVWKECIRVLQPNGKIAINLQPLPISSKHSEFGRRVIKNIMFDVEKFMRSHDFFLSGMIYWDKTPYINTVSWGSYPKPTNIATNTAFEQIFTFVKRGKTRSVNKKLQEKSILEKHEWRHWAVRLIWDDISPVIKINQKGKNLFGHGAPFPEDIPYRLIKMHTIQEETVLDPFLGSGTTLKLCNLTNRKGIGYEINPEFQDLIKSRIKESWQIPKIDSQYKTLSSENLTNIINSSIKKTIQLIQNYYRSQTQKQNNYNFYDNNQQDLLKQATKDVLKHLKKQNFLTKANIRKIKQNLKKKEN